MPASLLEGRLRGTAIQTIDLAWADEEQSEQSAPLNVALNASNTRVAFTLMGADNPYHEVRVVAVEESPRGQWWIHQWLLESCIYQGWPAADYRDADLFTVHQLSQPKAAIWWPAFGVLSVEYMNWQCYPERGFFSAAGIGLIDDSATPPALSAPRAVLHYLVARHNPGELAMYKTIEEELDMHGQILADALHELQDAGLIEVSIGPGNQIRHVTPLPQAWAAVDKSVIGFDIAANKFLIARCATYESPITAEALEERTGLPAHQLNITALLMREVGELLMSVQVAKAVID